MENILLTLFILTITAAAAILALRNRASCIRSGNDHLSSARQHREITRRYPRRRHRIRPLGQIIPYPGRVVPDAFPISTMARLTTGRRAPCPVGLRPPSHGARHRLSHLDCRKLLFRIVAPHGSFSSGLSAPQDPLGNMTVHMAMQRLCRKQGRRQAQVLKREHFGVCPGENYRKDPATIGHGPIAQAIETKSTESYWKQKPVPVLTATGVVGAALSANPRGHQQMPSTPASVPSISHPKTSLRHRFRSRQTVSILQSTPLRARDVTTSPG